MVPEKYDLRDSDFPNGVAISIKDATTLYQDEAIRNIEEEERRKFEEEEAKRKAEEGEGEGEKEPENSPSKDRTSPVKPPGEDNKRFMTEESFLERIHEIKKGSPKNKKKKNKRNPSVEKDNRSPEQDNFKHPDIPDMMDMSKKSKSVKVNLKKAKETIENEGEGGDTQRKLKIKNKKPKDYGQTKVERLVSLPQPDKARMNTLDFEEQENQENQKKKYDFNLEDTDPDLQFDPAKIKNIVTEPRETIKLANVNDDPIVAKNKYNSITSPERTPVTTTLDNKFVQKNN